MNQKAVILINFKVLEFTEPVDSEVIKFIEYIPEVTPNYLIRETLSILFERYRSTLKSESSELEIMALKLGEKQDYLTGEEPLFCYQEILMAHQLRQTIELVLVKLDRRKACRAPYSVTFSTKINYYTPESDMDLESTGNKAALNNNLILWQFSHNEEALETFNREQEEEKDLRDFSELVLKSMKREIIIRAVEIPMKLKNVFLSEHIRSSFTFKIKKILHTHRMFGSNDFNKDRLEKNKLGLLGVKKANLVSKNQRNY